jgi:hypothetical protein
MIPLTSPNVYTELDPAACPAGHPPEIIALRVCEHCQTANRRSGIWPPYCQFCHTERMYASWKRMEREGLICLVCLPMCADRLGQRRRELEWNH